MKIWVACIVFFAAGSSFIVLHNNQTGFGSKPKHKRISEVTLVILGTVQDAGSPQAGCNKDCCKDLFLHPDPNRKVVSLGIADQVTGKTYLFEATPDMPAQLKILKNIAGNKAAELPDAIFLTHAHIGHYTGLMYLGKEAMNANAVNVFAMPHMQNFLEKNGPWSQLVIANNIQLYKLSDTSAIKLSEDLSVIPIRVPHRDEFSETVGYKIYGPGKKVLFIPDIDKWVKWNRNILEEIAAVDYAFIDGTFFDAAEINNRDLSTIPHPFVIESMELFKKMPASEKNKIHFIHFNHTNPLLQKNSTQYLSVEKNGFHVAGFLQQIKL